MSETRRVCIKESNEFDMYMGRKGHGYTGYFGNPFKEGTKEENIANFREYFYDKLETDPVYKKKILNLKGLRLGCFCALHVGCHVDVILEYLAKNE